MGCPDRGMGCREVPGQPTVILAKNRTRVISAQRFSISFLMTIVLLVAVDFGIGRYVLRLPGDDGGAASAAIVALPMLNLLILTVPRLTGRLETNISAVLVVFSSGRHPCSSPAG